MKSAKSNAQVTKNKHASPRLAEKILLRFERLQRNFTSKAKSITLLPTHVLTPAEPHGPDIEFFRQTEQAFFAWTNKQIQTWKFCGQLKTLEGERQFSFETSFGLRHTEDDKVGVLPLRWFRSQIFSSQFLLVDSLNAEAHQTHRTAVRSSILPQSHAFVSYDRVHFEQDGWLMRRNFDGTWTIQAHHSGQSIQLTLTPMKRQIYPGQYGFIQKSDSAKSASLCCGYSLMRAKGTLVHNDRLWDVYGDVWLDHEKWTKPRQSTETLERQVEAYLRLPDSEELRLQIFLDEKNRPTHFSFGTRVDRDGNCTHLLSEDLSFSVVKYWRSSRSKTRYPTTFNIDIPSQNIALQIRPTNESQEIASGLFLRHTWRGEVRIKGQHKAKPVDELGFIEFSGFANEAN